VCRDKAIDITFDFRSDTPPGRDPDVLSPMLRRYHKLLWSKPLPGGAPCMLDDSTRGCTCTTSLSWASSSSPAMGSCRAFTREVRLTDIVSRIPLDELDEFNRIGYTTGGMMLFPGNRISRKMTINGGARIPSEDQGQVRPDG
jgi:hypothetical protein